MPFLSDKDLEAALEDAGVAGKTADAIVDENAKARLAGLRAALAVVALFAVAALFFTGTIPTRQPGSRSRHRARTTASRPRPRLGRDRRIKPHAFRGSERRGCCAFRPHSALDPPRRLEDG